MVTASCPALPGALSEGGTREEALANIREAMELWLDVAAERGEEPPPEAHDTVLTSIARALAHREELGWDTTLETKVVTLERAAAA